MANTSPVYARIDTSLKHSTETILSKLGITPSGAIQILYSQIVLHNGIPFDVRIPSPKPVAIGALSHAELDAELMKGVESPVRDFTRPSPSHRSSRYCRWSGNIRHLPP